MKTSLRSVGLDLILPLVLWSGMTEAQPLPSPYETEPTDTHTVGISGANLYGYFRSDGGPRELRYFIGPECSFFMDFAMPFTDGPGNDFAILTSSDSWEPVGSAQSARLDFFLDDSLQGSMSVSFLPDQLAEFDLPGNGLIANRIVLINLQSDSSDMTFDDAGVAYVIPEPSTVALACLGMLGLLHQLHFRCCPTSQMQRTRR